MLLNNSFVSFWNMTPTGAVPYDSPMYQSLLNGQDTVVRNDDFSSSLSYDIA